MKLKRPIVYFDIETTGLSLSEDRIIEISMTKINVNGESVFYYKRINPQGRKIMPEAFGKHGIKSEDLLECPAFPEVAEQI